MAHKMGIIGYGGQAGWHHSNESKFKDFKVVAAYDVDPARIEAAKSRGLKVYEKLNDFLADGSFDMVLVATPNDIHAEMTIAALNAGKNVICEKPVAMTVQDFDDMCAAADKNKKVFSVFQNRRWDRDFNIVKKVIRDGLIGKPYTIESRVMGQKGVMHGWRAYKSMGGGMIFDWGVHLIDQLLCMVAEPVKEVYSNLHMVKTPEVDDYFKAVIRFESGLSAQIEVGTYNLVLLPRWFVCGDSGAIIVQDWNCNGKIVSAKRTGTQYVQEVVQTAAGPIKNMAPRPDETSEELPLPEIETDWTEYYRNFFAVLDGKAELIVKRSEVRRVLQVMTAIFDSHETGRSIKLNI